MLIAGAFFALIGLGLLGWAGYVFCRYFITERRYERREGAHRLSADRTVTWLRSLAEDSGAAPPEIPAAAPEPPGPARAPAAGNGTVPHAVPAPGPGAPPWELPDGELAHDWQPGWDQHQAPLPGPTEGLWPMGAPADVTSALGSAGDQPGAARDTEEGRPSAPAAPGPGDPYAAACAALDALDDAADTAYLTAARDGTGRWDFAGDSGNWHLADGQYGQQDLTESGLMRALDWETIARMDDERALLSDFDAPLSAPREWHAELEVP